MLLRSPFLLASNFHTTYPLAKPSMIVYHVFARRERDKATRSSGQFSKLPSDEKFIFR